VIAIWRKLIDSAARAMATGLGTGYAPLAPGTAGSLLAAGLFWFLFPQQWWAHLVIVGACFLVGVAVSTRAEQWWGHDPGKVVIDEMAGMWLGLWLLPREAWAYLLALLVFRAFDIAKPLGIRQIQRAPAGWGVMLDDLLAGVYTNIVMQLFIIFLRPSASQLLALLKVQ